jgi:excisionase family DNA binding protein
MEKNLPVKAVAECLRISARGVYRLIADGELVAFKVRHSLRVPEGSLVDYQRRQIEKFSYENGTCLPDDDRS